jgi:hypothetical protein
MKYEVPLALRCLVLIFFVILVFSLFLIQLLDQKIGMPVDLYL